MSQFDKNHRKIEVNLDKIKDLLKIIWFMYKLYITYVKKSNIRLILSLSTVTVV